MEAAAEKLPAQLTAAKFVNFLVATSLLYFAWRFCAGKDLTKAGRVVGLVFCAATLAGAAELPGPTKFVTEAARTLGDRVLRLSAWQVAFTAFIYFAATHAINGLGIHDWHGLDIGFFVQATYNAFAGVAPIFAQSDGDFSFLGRHFSPFRHHFSPFLFLLSPLGRMSEAPFFLYLVQDVANAALAGLLFREVKRLPETSAAQKPLLLLLFLGHPFWTGLIRYELHELSFAPLAIFLLLKGWEAKKPWWLIGASLLLLTLKETAIFSLLFFGLTLVLFDKQRTMKAAGLVMAILAASIYGLYFKVMLPRLFGDTQSSFMIYYAKLGSNTLDVVLSPILRPKEFLSALFNFPNVTYAFAMFAALVPFFGRSLIFLVPVLPDFALVLLSNEVRIKLPEHQYAGLVLVPVFFIALRSKYWQENQTPLRERFVALWVAAASLAFISHNPIRTWKQFFLNDELGMASRHFISILRQLPKDAPVVVTDVRLLPFAAQRDNLIWREDGELRENDVRPGQFVLYRADSLKNPINSCNLIAEFGGFAACKGR